MNPSLLRPSRGRGRRLRRGIAPPFSSKFSSTCTHKIRKYTNAAARVAPMPAGARPPGHTACLKIVGNTHSCSRRRRRDALILVVHDGRVAVLQRRTTKVPGRVVPRLVAVSVTIRVPALMPAVCVSGECSRTCRPRTHVVTPRRRRRSSSSRSSSVRAGANSSAQLPQAHQCQRRRGLSLPPSPSSH